MTGSKHKRFRSLRRMPTVVLMAVALGAVAAPAATAHDERPLKESLGVAISLYDLHLSGACDTDVTAEVTGTLEKKLYPSKVPGGPAHELDTFRGEITWSSAATGKSYTSRMRNKQLIEYPEGIDLFAPVRVTVTGRHGGTFPIGGGPPGRGILVYDASIVMVEDGGFPFWFVNGDPTFASGNFDRATERICAALS
jgi:hypothetical protein